MTDDLRTRIAAVANTHTAMGFDSDYGPNDSWVCNCGLTWQAGGTHGDHMADAVIRELNLAKACEGGCVWQIPSRVKDMTPEQRKLLKRAGDE